MFSGNGAAVIGSPARSDPRTTTDERTNSTTTSDGILDMAPSRANRGPRVFAPEYPEFCGGCYKNVGIREGPSQKWCLMDRAPRRRIASQPRGDVSGPSPTRDSSRRRTDRLVYQRRAGAASVTVGGEPADPPARRRAARTVVPPARTEDSDHAGRNDAARTQPADVRGSRPDAREHSRESEDGERHVATRRRNDRVSVCLSRAAQGLPPRPSGGGRQADSRSDAATHPSASRRHRRSRPADACRWTIRISSACR